ncbi:hypothetical protein ACWEOH_17880 [Agromyces sp. NPDC004153]
MPELLALIGLVVFIGSTLFFALRPTLRHRRDARAAARAEWLAMGAVVDDPATRRSTRAADPMIPGR